MIDGVSGDSRQLFSISAIVELPGASSDQEAVSSVLSKQIANRNGVVFDLNEGRFGVTFDCIEGPEQAMIVSGVETLWSAFEATGKAFQISKCWLIGPPGVDSVDIFSKAEVTATATEVGKEIKELREATAEMFL